MICTFKVGDRVRKIVNSLVEDEIYTIEILEKTVEGDWHDGYYDVWYAHFQGCDKIHIIYFHRYGDEHYEYAILA
jgi:hypothetical protein